MKNILTIFLILLGINLYSQNKTYTDYDGDGIIEYKLQDQSNKIIEIGYYLNNKMHGTWTSFYPSGKKLAVVKFKNGIKHCKWFFFQEDGKVLMVVTYENDKKIMGRENHYTSQ